ncbi:hypothetical protein [Paenibacillus riograndensis]|uniref:hypothetical protein n=1 Tax=Paenibacillus riograndensis TaxID=483937 RepID=UPI001428BAC1|nr:hypothetical protein [Paenibacillus riograndensis]
MMIDKHGLSANAGIRGKSTFEFASGRLSGEMRGKSTFEFVSGGLDAEMRGKSTFEFGVDEPTQAAQ